VAPTLKFRPVFPSWPFLTREGRDDLTRVCDLSQPWLTGASYWEVTRYHHHQTHQTHQTHQNHQIHTGNTLSNQLAMEEITERYLVTQYVSRESGMTWITVAKFRYRVDAMLYITAKSKCLGDKDHAQFRIKAEQYTLADLSRKGGDRPGQSRDSSPSTTVASGSSAGTHGYRDFLSF
jgi:hypothetical protein